MILTDKATQRKHIKKQLSSISEAERQKASLSASLKLMELEAFFSAKTILAYCAMTTECDPSYAVSAARVSGKRIAFPLCMTKTEFLPCIPNNPDAFITGMYGITSPDITRSQIISFDEIDLVIVPGMAFDSNCHRLGRGAGYYDRFLKHTSAYKVGFAFDQQLLPEVSFDSMDVAMDCVITPSEVFWNSDLNIL